MKMNTWLCVLALSVAPITASAGNEPKNAHAFSFVSIDETETLDMKAYAGKAVMVVNTASFCGFTHQYSGLEKLWRTHREAGLVVLGVPSNDFGSQEPKSESEIKSFCQGAFNITFPLTKKTRVRGAKSHGFYQWVASTTSGKASPRWNFHKLLIGKDGRLVKWFPSSIEPGSAKVNDAITSALSEPAPAS